MCRLMDQATILIDFHLENERQRGKKIILCVVECAAFILHQAHVWTWIDVEEIEEKKQHKTKTQGPHGECEKSRVCAL